MQPSNRFRSFTVISILAAVTVLLSSFGSMFGGDSYTIFINKKLLSTQYVGHSSEQLVSLPVNSLKEGDQIRIHYNHCGKVGKSRSLTIKNDKGDVLKTWKFADFRDKDMYMTIPASEILELTRNHKGSSLNLYYASVELPDGKAVAAINRSDKAITGVSDKKTGMEESLIGGLYSAIAMIYVIH